MDHRPSNPDRLWLFLANTSVLILATALVLFVVLYVAGVVWDFGPMVPPPSD